MRFLGKKTSLGLDISQNSIKIVELQKKRDKISLINIGEAKIPIEKTLNEEKENKLNTNEIISTLKNLLNRYKIRSKKVIASIPSGDFVVIKHIKMPIASEKELRESIKYEADDYIPFEIEEVEIDFEITGEIFEHEENMIELLLVAAKKDIVNQYEEIIKKIGLKTDVISVDTFALEDAYFYQREDLSERVIALVDIGAKVTSINIIENGKSQFNRIIHLGGEDFTEAISNAYGISLEEAEELKLSKGKVTSPIENIELAAMNISIIEEDQSMFLASAVDTVASRLMSEINRSFSYYYTQLRKGMVERLILCGGGAKLININDYLANGLGIPVDNISFFDKIEIDYKYINKEKIHLQDPLYAVSFGLALRGLNL